jgi:hypothetical protein
MDLLQQICNFLREKQWSFVVQEALSRITLKVSTDDEKTYSVELHVRANVGIIIGMLRYPRKCDPDNLERMLKFLSRQNFELFMGGFEMSPETGVLKYRNSIDVESLELNADFIDNFVRGVATFGVLYAPALNAVLDGKSLDDANRFMC